MSGLTVVTGGSGFIGQHLARRLLDAGRPIRVLARRPDLLPPDIARRAEVVCGDVRDAAAVDQALAGADVVLHLAACARAWARDADEFQRVNVGAVETLVRTARRQGVRRLVHVSTVLTLKGTASNRVPTPYEETKLAGERIAEDSGLAVVVHPTRVFGPGPLNDANGVSRLIATYLSGRLVVRLDDSDVQANYVHVDDVAGGIVLAADSGECGAHYVLGGENLSVRELFDRVAALSGVRRTVYPVRPGLALAAATVAEGWGRLGGVAPITRAWVRSFLEDQRLNGERVPPGYCPLPLDDRLRATIEWLRQQKRYPS
jgi:nucleoside-diphosphate-sugar epimerase